MSIGRRLRGLRSKISQTFQANFLKIGEEIVTRKSVLSTKTEKPRGFVGGGQTPKDTWRVIPISHGHGSPITS